MCPGRSLLALFAVVTSLGCDVQLHVLQRRSLDQGVEAQDLPKLPESGPKLDVLPATQLPNCGDKTQEPNDSPTQASSLVQATSSPKKGICAPGDKDYYWVQLAAGKKLSVGIDFEHQAGDLDLLLLGPQGETLALSATQDSDEKIEHVAKAPGRYWVVVQGATHSTMNHYLLRAALP